METNILVDFLLFTKAIGMLGPCSTVTVMFLGTVLALVVDIRRKRLAKSVQS